MTKRMRLVALALAVLLAGCSGGEKKAVSPWGEKADRDFFIRLGSSAARTIADDFEEEGSPAFCGWTTSPSKGKTETSMLWS